MGKATVLNCDSCSEWDAEGNAVRKVPFCGTKVDLCQKCRVKLLMELGIDMVAAVRFVEAYDKPRDVAGRPLSLATIIREVRIEAKKAAQDATNSTLTVVPDSAADEEPKPEESTEDTDSGDAVVNGEVTEETQPKKSAARSRTPAKR